MVLPHDVVDLQLAPVALALDQELEVLGRLDGEALLHHILIATNRRAEDAADQTEREAMVVRVLTQFIDLHGWEVTCDPRGVRLTHHDRRIVLGIPDSVREFVEAVAI
jgi:hypothetical protein